MKLLTVLHSHSCGGAEKHALHLMQGLTARGHEVIWCGPRDSWLHEAATAAGIPCRHLPMHGFYDLFSITRLALLARRYGAQLIHGHLTRGAFYAGLAARLAGIPAMATAHSTNAVKHFGRCRRIVAVCRGVRNALIDSGYRPERLRVVYNGVPDVYARSTVTRASARSALGIEPDMFVIGMVARYIRDKGHDVLLDAVSRLQNGPLRVLLFGAPEGRWYKHVMNALHDGGLAQSVKVLGQRDDVATLLPAMDILVAPSRREAMSLAIIEALGAGLPVIASRVGGIPEIIHHGENGMLVPAGDAGALALAIERLRSAPDTRERMGRAARRLYLESFSLDIMVQQTENIYRELQTTR